MSDMVGNPEDRFSRVAAESTLQFSTKIQLNTRKFGHLAYYAIFAGTANTRYTTQYNFIAFKVDIFPMKINLVTASSMALTYFRKSVNTRVVIKLVT